MIILLIYLTCKKMETTRESHIPRQQAIHQLFDDIAPTYDVLNHLFSLNIDRWWRYKALHAITLPRKACVLDVCTGTADVALAAARHFPESRIYGVDFAQTMLRHGQTKIAQHRHEASITLVRADALALPFPAKTFDAAFLSFGLRNLADRQAGIQELHRVLRPDGCLVILEFAPPPDTLFGRMFRLYVGGVMPIIGRLISKSPSGYHYLHRSIEQFPEPSVIMRFLHDANFQSTRCQSIIPGMVSLYVGQKIRIKRRF